MTSPVAPASRGLGCNKSAYLEIYTPERSIKKKKKKHIMLNVKTLLEVQEALHGIKAQCIPNNKDTTVFLEYDQRKV